MKLSAAIITVSDTRTEANDLSGQLLRHLFTEAGHSIGYYTIVPDEPERIREIFGQLDSRADIDVIVLNGGTGISPRDQTYEAIVALLDKRLDGFGELFRWLSYQEIGPAAMLSRAIGGIWHGRLVFSLPGSPAAVRLATEKLILPQLGHAVSLARGEATLHPVCKPSQSTPPQLVTPAVTQPILLRPLERAQFHPEKMAKVSLFASPRLMLGLNCLEPGQEHQLHTHTDQDKAYLVLQGEGTFLLPQGQQPMRPGDLLIAPAEVPHGIRNTGGERLTVLVIMAPAPR